MTPEAKRLAIAMVMGFKDADFLKWHDGMYEAQQWLIDRQKEAGSDMDNPHYGVWSRYVEFLHQLSLNTGFYGGNIHATVEQKQDAFLKAIGVLK